MNRAPGNNTFKSVNTIYNVARILAALATPQTYAQLSASLHMTDRSVRRYVAHLRATPNRRVRVQSYLEINGYFYPIFALGSKLDAVRRFQTDKEKCAKYRAKVKATPELQERQQRRDAARWAVKKAKKAPQHWASPLLGAAVREVRDGR